MPHSFPSDGALPQVLEYQCDLPPHLPLRRPPAKAYLDTAPPLGPDTYDVRLHYLRRFRLFDGNPSLASHLD